MFALFLSYLFAASQPVYLVTLDLIESGEHMEASETWQTYIDESNEEACCKIQKTIEVKKLPFSYQEESWSLLITKEGKVDVNYSYGDADAGAAASTYIPKNDDLQLELSGGDYASGAWSVTGKIHIQKVLDNESNVVRKDRF